MRSFPAAAASQTVDFHVQGGLSTGTVHVWATDVDAPDLGIREAFLSAPRVRNAYFGYAVQQFKKLEKETENRNDEEDRKHELKRNRCDEENKALVHMISDKSRL